ncbi:MAG: iron ABC transporter permease [Chloroflexota bacterium]|nr:iron ABC transporter permease [Chloroflexota bacterium]
MKSAARVRPAFVAVRRWRAPRLSLLGRAGTLLLSAPVILPLLYLVWLALQASLPSLWEGLMRAHAGRLILRVALMASGATLLATLIGAPWAWLAARTDVPGGRFFGWLGPLPLAIPPYVGALVYIILLGKGGLLHETVADLLGRGKFQLDYPNFIYGPAGAAFVLGLFGSPYVFLNVHGALQRMDPALEDAARSLGQSPPGVFRRVTLPLLRPALLAGALLVFVYAWVDFGVVSLMRARTFTTVVRTYLLAGFSLPAAAGLSLLLVAIVWCVLLVQHRALGGARYTQAGTGRTHTPRRTPLGWWRWAAFAYLLLAVTLTLGLPLGVLVLQVSKLSLPELGTFLLEQREYVWNSLQVALVGSLAALALAGLVGWQGWRRRDTAGAVAGAVLQAGYAVPGTVLGLSLVGLSLALVPQLYRTPVALLGFAYVVLFAAPTLQGVRAALAQVPPSMEEAVRALGRGPITAAVRVVGPLAWPGIAASWLLTFILCMRELSATIILRPAGFDTLPVRIWTHTMDVGADPRASVVALLLVVFVGIPWLVLLSTRGPGVRQGGTNTVL